MKRIFYLFVLLVTVLAVSLSAAGKNVACNDNKYELS